jgi:hypothetical protein
MTAPPPFSPAPPLVALRAVEARLLGFRAAPANPEAAADEALDAACGDAATAAERAVARRFAAAVRAHGASFGARGEPAYHDCQHQAEATRVAGWLAHDLCARGLIDRAAAARCVLAMMAHDLLHDGSCTGPPGALEARSAAAAEAMATGLDPAARAEITRLILLTNPLAPAPADLAGRLVREADLFASLTPDLGWRLSSAFAAELQAAGHPGADAVLRFAGRLAILRAIQDFTPAAIALGLAAGCALQVRAMAEASGRATPEDGAAALDALPRPAALAAYHAAMARLGLPGLPA